MDKAGAQRARAVWQALLRSVRNCHFYSLDHGTVQRNIDELRLACAAGLQVATPLVFRLAPPAVTVEDHTVYDGRSDRPDVAAALVGHGIHGIALQHPPDFAACARVVELVALYDGVEETPGQALAEVVQWEALPGFLFDVRRSGAPAPAAPIVGRDHLEKLLEHGAGVDDPLPLQAVRGVWDLRGGRLRWPPATSEAEAQALAAEVRTANQRGTPTSRVGMLLGQAIAARAGEPRGLELVAPVPAQVQRLLADHRVGDVPRLLSPLFRWASQPPTNAWAQQVQERILDLVPQLLAPGRMEELLDGVSTGMVSPPQLAAYLAALPPHAVGEVMALAARLESGPHRTAVEEAIRRAATRSPEALVHAAKSGPPGIAVRALEMALAQPDYPHLLRLGLVCLDSPEPIVRRSAARVLSREPSRHVAARFLRHLQDGDADVRAMVVQYLGRYRINEAFPKLKAAATGPNFHLLDLEERFRICTALGRIGGDRALALARKALRNWEQADPDRAGPWLRCLVAMGTDAGIRELKSLVRRAPDQVRDIAELTLEEAELGALGGPESPPALRTRPGQVSPSEPLPDASFGGLPEEPAFELTLEHTGTPAPRAARGGTPPPTARGVAPPSRRHRWASDRREPEPAPVDGNALLWGDD